MTFVLCALEGIADDDGDGVMVASAIKAQGHTHAHSAERLPLPTLTYLSPRAWMNCRYLHVSCDTSCASPGDNPTERGLDLPVEAHSFGDRPQR